MRTLEYKSIVGPIATCITDMVYMQEVLCCKEVWYWDDKMKEGFDPKLVDWAPSKMKIALLKENGVFQLSEPVKIMMEEVEDKLRKNKQTVDVFESKDIKKLYETYIHIRNIENNCDPFFENLPDEFEDRTTEVGDW